MEKAMETGTAKPECQFQLKRDKLLHDVINLDFRLTLTQGNISNERALYHLKTNPGCAECFVRLPAEWMEQAAGFDLATMIPEDLIPEKLKIAPKIAPKDLKAETEYAVNNGIPKNALLPNEHTATKPKADRSGVMKRAWIILREKPARSITWSECLKTAWAEEKARLSSKPGIGQAQK
jgi:hypothetical protein